MILYDVYGKVESTLLKIVITLFIFQEALGVTMQGRDCWNHAAKHAKTASIDYENHQKWRLNPKQVLNNPPWEHLWKSRWTSALTCENM